MCGLAGFSPRDGQSPTRSLVRLMVGEAARRGPHSWGIMQAEESRLRATWGTGSPVLPPVTGAFVFHARMATNGQWRDHADAQPVLTEDRSFALAHNGIIPGVTLAPDSLLLAQRIAEGATLREVMEEVREQWPDIRQAALLLRCDGSLEAVSVGHPLYVLDQPEGWYYCSRPFAGAHRLEG